MSDTWDEVRRWRARAEEIRTLADQFSGIEQREPLRRIAASYDTLAQTAEARLRHAPWPPVAAAGGSLSSPDAMNADRGL